VKTVTNKVVRHSMA